MQACDGAEKLIKDGNTFKDEFECTVNVFQARVRMQK